MKTEKEKTLLDAIIEKKLEDPEFRRHYEREKLTKYIARIVRDARQNTNITQTELADRVGTKQSAIARLESGRAARIPSLDLLQRIGRALNVDLILKFKSKSFSEEKAHEIIKSEQVGSRTFENTFVDMQIDENLIWAINVKGTSNIEEIDKEGLLSKFKNNTSNRDENIRIN